MCGPVTSTSFAGVEHNIGGPFSVGSVYAQSEYQPLHSLSVTTGVRYDRYAHVTATLNPRGAVVWHIDAANTLKVLYGSAFRLPTVFELGLEDASQNFLPNQNLRPEKIRQHEVVWEGRLTPEVLLSVSPYRLHMTGLIKPQTDAATGDHPVPESQRRHLTGCRAAGRLSAQRRTMVVRELFTSERPRKRHGNVQFRRQSGEGRHFHRRHRAGFRGLWSWCTNPDERPSPEPRHRA